MASRTISIQVRGRVQQVGFRYHTKSIADKLGISGFVMNKPDGSVYIEANGNEPGISQFIEWCKKGPDWAQVRDFKIQNLPTCNYDGFVVKR